MNPYSVGVVDGIPRLLKNGKPEIPLFFWQTLLEEKDVKPVRRCGIEIFTCFRSSHARDFPWWIGEDEYDFSWIDARIDEFFKIAPDAWLIPRIFVFAPEWFLEAHPEAQAVYPDHSEQGKPPRESVASPVWREKQGEALRTLIRHFKSMPWGDRIIGIHVACGSCGEWNGWNPLQPDISAAMLEKCGCDSVPPEYDGNYVRSFFDAAAEAIEHFCRIVKEETDWLTVIFYGYYSCNYRPWNKHGALDRILRSEYVDIIAAPHEYSRRMPGDDGYFRALAATILKNGKLFVDEADDRTPLAHREELGARQIMADTATEAVGMMRRELGNTLTNLTGMWYMDIDDGMFRSNFYWREIARGVEWNRRALELPWKRVSQIAVVIAERNRYDLPMPLRLMAYDAAAFQAHMIPALCRCGAPFDLYTEADADFETLSGYRMVILMDGLSLRQEFKDTLKKLRGDRRAMVWCYGSGSWHEGRWDTAEMTDLTAIHFEQTPEQPMLIIDDYSYDWHQGTISPGFAPLKASADFGSWSSWYLGTPEVNAEELRNICRSCGVFIYSDSDDVIAVSESALMFHASTSGEKVINLPRFRKVIDMVGSAVVGENICQLKFCIEKGETRLFELWEC